MATMAVLRGCLCAVLLVLGADSAEVTPMEKVIRLLKDLSAKVTEDGKLEAAAYDKYACFCKEQADDKLYAIEKSDKKLGALKAQIDQLETSIAELNSEISDLSKKVTTLEGEIKTATEKRAEEHKEYLAKAKDMKEAIGACDAAIAALKDSKKAMKGAKVDLAQVRKATQGLAGALHQLKMPDVGVAALLEQLSGKDAPKFQYQSNDIIATLEDLLARFKRMKKDLDTEEFDINAAFDSKVLGLSNEKKFAEKEKSQKAAIVASKEEELNGAKNEKEAETADRDADQAFLDQLTNDCQEKALLFDQRSKTRADELRTITEATEKLEQGAAPNFSANKKLVDLQKKPAVVKKAAISPQALSFVQIENVKYDNVHHHVAVQKVLELLHKTAGKTGSSALANTAIRVKMAEDHFVKVRQLIKDIISKLEADAEAEATQKAYCDKHMKEAVEERDEASANIEDAEGRITTLTARKESLKKDIADLEKEIASLKKELLQATELRNQDKADHAKTVAMSEEAIENVKLALNLLSDFYGKAALAQTGKYVPPDSDREGNTVGDLAPKVFDSEYKGATSESKGIIGILEVILSDFERTKSTTEKDELESQEAFEEIEKQTKETIGEHEKTIEEKDGLLTDTNADLVEQQDNLKDAQDLLEGAKEKLADLEKMCVAGEESWEERKQKREEEIEALKDALNILENWDQ